MRLSFKQEGGETRLDTLRQSGAARVRFPKPAGDADPEAVLLNTAGGLTGGDRIDVAVTLGAGCGATVTSAAAEKVYRSLGDPTEIRIDVQLGPRSSCSWLPQPTIIFNGANLHRRTQVHMAADARLLAVEMLIYGRAAMGEHVHNGMIHDAWRVTRGGRLAYADTTRVDGIVADVLAHGATLDGARATAMMIYIAPDAERHRDAVRTLLEPASSPYGVSSWNGMLLVRMAARDGRDLQRAMQPVITRLSGRALPRVWQC